MWPAKLHATVHFFLLLHLLRPCVSLTADEVCGKGPIVGAHNAKQLSQKGGDGDGEGGGRRRKVVFVFM